MPPTRGAAMLVALLFVVAAALLVLWIVLGSEDETPPVRMESPVRSAEAAPTAAGRTAAPEAPAEEPAESRERLVDARPDDAAVRFDGRGTIRGHVEPADGRPFPSRWTLVLEPAPFLPGSERAEARRIAFEDGATEFEVGDLPFGGYAVSAKAEGLNGPPVTIVLQRNSGEAYVSLGFEPAGFLEGQVVDTEGAPVAGLPIHLQPRGELVRRRTETDGAGRYHFDDVVDGSYELHFGQPESPLIPSGKLSFQAPSMRFPTKTAPPFADLEIVVVDASDAPVQGALVRGSGTQGGHVDATTDAAGVVLARFLPLGRYRFHAEHPDFGRGFEAIRILEEGAGRLELRLE